MSKGLLQWNCRGIRPNYEELKLLIKENNPTCICLQETMLKPNDNLHLNRYSLERKDQTGDRAHGGVAIFINNSTPYTSVNLQTNLQAVAVQLKLHKLITVCSIYLPPKDPLDAVELEQLLSQLPKPFILLGDFNCHNTLWGCDHTTPKGRALERTIFNNNLVILNDLVPTHFHVQNGSFSAIDLALSTPCLKSELNWTVDEDLHGSDHFPIHITTVERNLRTPQTSTKWNLNKADWQQFTSLLDGDALITYSNTSLNEQVEQFTTTLISAANKSIPKTRTTNCHPSVPWWNKTCEDSIRDRKRQLRHFRNNPTVENLIAFKKARAAARQNIRLSKQESWQSYASSINSHTPVKQVWQKIKTLNGKRASCKIPALVTDDDETVYTLPEIANTLAKSFASNSSSQNYTSTFTKHKSQAEKTKPNFNSDNTESYNKPFTIAELDSAISKGKSTSPGPDGIHNDMLKHLNSNGREKLLELYNNIWASDDFPDSWREAFIIPIPKPRKDHTRSTNHRPISLTSCLCKLMERMICSRLRWFLEKNGLLANCQSGARQERSTTDHLVALDTKIREALVQNHHAVAVFFDLEKAYDTTWRHGILQKLQEYGLKGHLPKFVQNFLEHRTFKVKVGNTYSDEYTQENGIQQGSLISVLCFLAAIDDVVKCVPDRMLSTLYMDDFTILCTGPSMPSIERQLQLTLNKLSQFEKTTGFKFSTSKTVCMHFCRKRKAHDDPQLTLGNTVIPVVETNPYLGLIFDSRLTWIPHIKQLKDKCLRAMDTLRSISHTSWGADRSILLQLYRALIRSKLDYGCEVYSGAHHSALKMLDPIHNLGLRLSTGAFITSPSVSLHAETHELPLQLRRQQICAQYAIRLLHNTKHPTYPILFNYNLQQSFDNKPSIVSPLGIRIRNFITQNNIQFPPVYQKTYVETPFWDNHHPNLVTDLTMYRKETTPDHTFNAEFLRLTEAYPDHNQIYTDGSKTDAGTGCAFVSNSSSFSYKLHDYASIFTAELFAILKALQYIKCLRPKKFLILTDSFSSVQTINQLDSRNPIVTLIQHEITKLKHMDKDIIIFWIPGHVGITGNEKADKLAKEAVYKRPIYEIPILNSDIKPFIRANTHQAWKNEWESTHNKLSAIKPSLTDWKTCNRKNRREEVVLARLRIGHTRLTHKHLFTRDAAPVCHDCNKEVTVKHIIEECTKYNSSRKKYFEHMLKQGLVLTTKSVLAESEHFDASAIFNYLKDINLYKEL